MTEALMICFVLIVNALYLGEVANQLNGIKKQLKKINKKEKSND